MSCFYGFLLDFLEIEAKSEILKEFVVVDWRS